MRRLHSLHKAAAAMALSMGLSLGLPAHAASADNCESIRAGIQARYRAGGVGDVRLQIVDAAAVGAAKVVGRCALGTKRIVVAGAAVASAAARPSGTAKSPEPMLTECRDGSVSVGGDCRHPAPGR